ncbi:MAG: hypothetical protein ACUVSZ_16885, partial [Chloroflexus sp.]|uniref:hypothetical protein n=1 Tax=Chloroflexus sp. TaxID=1904827 RepID=UPI004049E433
LFYTGVKTFKSPTLGFQALDKPPSHGVVYVTAFTGLKLLGFKGMPRHPTRLQAKRLVVADHAYERVKGYLLISNGPI